jgi:anaerobic selenocysteine-containing dehydrogenase
LRKQLHPASASSLNVECRRLNLELLCAPCWNLSTTPRETQDSGVCPTGALMFKSEHDTREAGTWDESRQTATDTICAYCGVGRTLTVHVQDDKIVKATSPVENGVTRGHLCIKGRFGWEFANLRG